MHDLVSIIVPIYKVEAYLRRCINSILAQTYVNIEVILVDDGSPDRCGEICNEYALLDSRITVIHKENGGLSDARNAGIDAAKGTYLIFIDSDDYVNPSFVEKLYNAAESNNAELAICNFITVQNGRAADLSLENLPIKNEVIGQKEAIQNRIFSGRTYWSVACTKIYDKRIFNDLRFPKGKVHEDEFILHSVLLQCHQIACISDPLYYYEQRSDSITGQSMKISKLDAVEALICRADTLSDYPNYLIPALYSLKDAGSLFHFYYKNCGSPPDNIHKNRNRNLQKQYRKAYKKILAKKGFRISKLFLRISLDALSMYWWGKVESLIRYSEKGKEAG